MKGQGKGDDSSLRNGPGKFVAAKVRAAHASLSQSAAAVAGGAGGGLGTGSGGGLGGGMGGGMGGGCGGGCGTTTGYGYGAGMGTGSAAPLLMGTAGATTGSNLSEKETEVSEWGRSQGCLDFL